MSKFEVSEQTRQFNELPVKAQETDQDWSVKIEAKDISENTATLAGAADSVVLQTYDALWSVAGVIAPVMMISFVFWMTVKLVKNFWR